MYVKCLPNNLIHKLHNKNYELPEDGLELRPKHVAAVSNKRIVQQVGIKNYIWYNCVPDHMPSRHKPQCPQMSPQ